MQLGLHTAALGDRTWHLGVCFSLLILSLPLNSSHCVVAQDKQGGQKVIVKPKSQPNVPIGSLEVSWPVTFELEQESANGGWIIQEIQISEELKDWNGKTVKREKPLPHYWEAWWVEKGTKTPDWQLDEDGNWISDRLPHGDLNRNPQRPEFDDTYSHRYVLLDSRMSNREHADFSRGTSGALTIRGWIMYYEGALPKNFIRNNPRTNAGLLLSDDKKPSFWTREGTTDHSLIWSFDSNGFPTKEPETTPKFLPNESQNSGTGKPKQADTEPTDEQSAIPERREDVDNEHPRTVASGSSATRLVVQRTLHDF